MYTKATSSRRHLLPINNGIPDKQGNHLTLQERGVMDVTPLKALKKKENAVRPDTSMSY